MTTRHGSDDAASDFIKNLSKTTSVVFNNIDRYLEEFSSKYKSDIKHNRKMNHTLSVLTKSRAASSTSTASAEEEMEEGNKSIILDIIGQLRNGTDFHKVTLPTFILEARSMCERLSDFFCFQEHLLK